MSLTIDNMNTFCSSVRKNAALAMCARDEEEISEITQKQQTELNELISLGQIKSLVLEKKLGLCDVSGKVIINDDIFEEIFSDVSQIIYGFALCKLAAEDKVECAWDDENNEMIFWTKSLDKEAT